MGPLAGGAVRHARRLAGGQGGGSRVVAAVLLALLDRAFGPLGHLLPIPLLTAGYAPFQTANNSAVVGRRRASRGAVAGLLTPVAQPGPADGGGGAGGLFARPGGAARSALATADELAFATWATFALTALLLMSARSGWQGRGACRAG